MSKIRRTTGNSSNEYRRVRGSGGFTLVEVIVVMAIIGILTAIALPSYRDYVLRGQRAEARTQLLEAAQFMQRFYSANDRYDRDRGGAAVALPLGLQTAPSGGTARYTLSLNAISTTGYTLQAVPVGTMVGDKCGTYTLNSVGRRDVLSATETLENCWR